MHVAGQKTSYILSFIKRSMTSRAREVILPLYLFWRSHLEYCIHLRSPVQERQGPVRAGPEEDHENVQRDEHFSFEERLRARVVWLREGEAFFQHFNI